MLNSCTCPNRPAFVHLNCLVIPIIIMHNANGQLPRSIWSVGHDLGLHQTFPAFPLAGFPSSRPHLRWEGRLGITGNHLSDAPLSRSLFKDQGPSLRPCQDLLQGNINSSIHPVSSGWVLQFHTVVRGLTHHDIGARAGFPQQVFGWSGFSRHPPEDDFPRNEIPVVPGLVHLHFLSHQSGLLMPMQNA